MSNTLIDHTGQTFGDLTVTSRAGADIAGHATWHVACTCGTHTTARGDYLRTGRTHHCGHKGRKRQPVITYSGAHNRLSRVLGSASGYTCPCGAPAREWAFLGCDEAVSSGPIGAYCKHACPDEYAAMCGTCADLTDVLVREASA